MRCQFEETFGCPNGPGGDEFAAPEHVQCGAPATEVVLIVGPEWHGGPSPFLMGDLLYTCDDHRYPDSQEGLLGDWVAVTRTNEVAAVRV